MAVLTHSSNPAGHSAYSPQELIFGIALIILSVLIQAIQFVVEEKLLGNMYISSKRMTGWEGIWGILLFTVFLTIAYFVKCTGNLCTNGRLEDPFQALEQMRKSSFITFGMISLAFFGCILNVFGILVTKYTTSAHRATINQVKVASIWMFFLAYTGHHTQETFLPLQLVGFIIVLTGVCLFNEILVLPFWGLNKKTKKAMQQHCYTKTLKLVLEVNDPESQEETVYSYIKPLVQPKAKAVFRPSEK